MRRMILTLIILAAAVGQGFTQEKLKIGDVVDGKFKVTNDAGLKSFFFHSLGNSGILEKDIKVETSPTSDRFLAYAKVSGNKNGISAIGVLLINLDSEVYIVGNQPDQPIGPGVGGSLTYSCIGDPCDNCNIKITWPSGSWKPDVMCECQASGGICNMTVTLTLNVNIGIF